MYFCVVADASGDEKNLHHHFDIENRIFVESMQMRRENLELIDFSRLLTHQIVNICVVSPFYPHTLKGLKIKSSNPSSISVKSKKSQKKEENKLFHKFSFSF